MTEEKILAVEAARLYNEIKEDEFRVEEKKHRLALLNAQLLAQWEEENTELQRVEHDGMRTSVYTQDFYSATIEKGKSSDVVRWFKERHKESLLTESINAKRLASYCKELEDMGGELPPHVRTHRGKVIRFKRTAK